jgi:membrane-associated phospholipid phosphatase
MKSSQDARACEVLAPQPGASLRPINRALNQAFATLMRRQASLPAAYVPVWRRLALPGLFVAGIIFLSMVFVDASARTWATGEPRWLVDLFEEITDFGRSVWILVPVGALMLITAVLASRTLDRFSHAVLALVTVRLGFVFVAVGLPGLVATIVKRWIGRVRPSDQGPFAYEPFSWRSEFASLPSGHATTAFAALVAIGLLFPRARPALWVYALLIAASRIVVGAHYTSDVIAGAFAGVLGALLVRDWMARRRLGFFVASDGRLRVRSAPSLRRLKRVAAAFMAP